MRTTIYLSSALLVAAALAMPASAQTSNQGKYCLQGSGTDAKTNCTFQTMAACEKAKQGQAQQCVENKGMTTGSGGMQNKKN